jgi:rhodanese-related sulfurtransferase
MTLLRQWLFLALLVFAGAGVSAMMVSPRHNGLLAAEEITFESAQGLSSVLWVDARNAGDFERGHIPGAVSLNEDNWSQAIAHVLSAWQPENVVVVYCGGATCAASHAVAARLRGAEYQLSPVYVLRGGWEAWTKQPSKH